MANTSRCCTAGKPWRTRQRRGSSSYLCTLSREEDCHSKLPGTPGVSNSDATKASTFRSHKRLETYLCTNFWANSGRSFELLQTHGFLTQSLTAGVRRKRQDRHSGTDS